MADRALPDFRAEPIIRFGAFEVDIGRGELRKNGLKVRLQIQPFQVLLKLLKVSGEVVTREELRDSVWPQDTFVDFDCALNTAVKKIRAALDDDADNPRFLETVPRRGYRFIAVSDGHGPGRRPEQQTAPASRRVDYYQMFAFAAVTVIGILVIRIGARADI
jgi:DNA-binding winged helix-turn-helix (wHTH) protein